MNITIFCTDRNHPVVPYLENWRSELVKNDHEITIVYDKNELSKGDILFLISCSQIVDKRTRQNYKATLVLHASNLPEGRGWSPHIWEILKGSSELTVCLLEATDPVDTGDIWLREKISLEGHELLPEINDKVFRTELILMTEAISKFDSINPKPQKNFPANYYKKRVPEDSKLDPNKTIAEQFDLLRIVDSERYPAFIDYRNNRYILRINKVEKND